MPFQTIAIKGGMTIENIEKKWLLIEGKTIDSGFHSIRISKESIPELFLGFDSNGTRTLILSCPKSYELKFKGLFKQNLSIDFFEESNHIVVKLENRAFNDLFNDLILSLYRKICLMDQPEEYVEEFIKGFYRWSGFFSDLNTVGLSEELIKGIFGELVLLREILKDSNPLSVDKVLDSWKGPFDARHDFESDERCIEVKTKELSKTYVRISSEYQLELSLDKPLELCIVSLSSGLSTDIAILELIQSIKEIVWEKHGDMLILLNALSRKGLFESTISLYDHIKFTPEKIDWYDCTISTFPKIVGEELRSGIFDVSYSLSISRLTDFFISERKL